MKYKLAAPQNVYSAKSPFNNFVEKSIHMIDLKNSLS